MTVKERLNGDNNRIAQRRFPGGRGVSGPIEPARSRDVNEFYGSNDQLRRYHRRFRIYFAESKRDLPILDLGCGSGVFLELLREQNRSAVGVERNEEAVAFCRAKGLEVVQDNVLDYLQDKHECYAGIYCSHLIEHFAYEPACSLIELAHQALAPGGRFIVITPNPASIEVISEIFWLDPSHVRPYPLPLLIKMVAQAGFGVLMTGQDTAPGLPRRGIPRRFLLRVLLGRHYGKMNSFVVAEKTSRSGSSDAGRP